MNDPKTFPEMLDAAAAIPDQGEAFARVLNSLFGIAAQAKDDDE